MIHVEVLDSALIIHLLSDRVNNMFILLWTQSTPQCFCYLPYRLPLSTTVTLFQPQSGPSWCLISCQPYFYLSAFVDTCPDLFFLISSSDSLAHSIQVRVWKNHLRNAFSESSPCFPHHFLFLFPDWFFYSSYLYLIVCYIYIFNIFLSKYKFHEDRDLNGFAYYYISRTWNQGRYTVSPV